MSLIQRLSFGKQFIWDKVRNEVNDNASVIDATFAGLGFIRIPCFCRVLNLALGNVKSIMKSDLLLSFVKSVATSPKCAANLK
jgi:hypothetical protein